MLRIYSPGEGAFDTAEPVTWTPPPFDELEDYRFHMCMTHKTTIPLGLLNELTVKLDIVSPVRSWKRKENDLSGSKLLKVTKDGKLKEISAKVLGSVVGTGTAVLLDDIGNVWLYQFPEAKYTQFEGFDHEAAIILKAGDVAGIGRELELEEIYEKVEIFNTESPVKVPGNYKSVRYV